MAERMNGLGRRRDDGAQRSRPDSIAALFDFDESNGVCLVVLVVVVVKVMGPRNSKSYNIFFLSAFLFLYLLPYVFTYLF